MWWTSWKQTKWVYHCAPSANRHRTERSLADVPSTGISAAFRIMLSAGETPERGYLGQSVWLLGWPPDACHAGAYEFVDSRLGADPRLNAPQARSPYGQSGENAHAFSPPPLPTGSVACPQPFPAPHPNTTGMKFDFG